MVQGLGDLVNRGRHFQPLSEGTPCPRQPRQQGRLTVSEALWVDVLCRVGVLRLFLKHEVLPSGPAAAS